MTRGDQKFFERLKTGIDSMEQKINEFDQALKRLERSSDYRAFSRPVRRRSIKPRTECHLKLVVSNPK